MQKGRDTWLVGKMGVRRPQVDKKDSGKMGFFSLALGGMGTANRPGSPPNPSGGWCSPTMLGL